MEAEASYYHFLVGILNTEYDGERSFATMYGFSEVLPGRVTTDRVVSGDGKSYFDMLANAMKLGDVFDFNSAGDGKLRLKGTIVQNQGGDESPVGVYRGLYNASYTYYNGDEVAFSFNGITSTYRYVYATPSKGVEPTNTTYWQVQAAGVKGEDGQDGADGKDGKDGTSVAVSKNDIAYQASNNGTSVPTGTWLPTPPALQKGQFLWTRTIVTYTDGNSTTAYSVSYYGTDGANGKDGTSITIKSSTVQYAVEATGTQPADSAFVYNSIPVVEVGKYLWSLTKVVYSDGKETKCYGVFRIGEDGEQGAQGVAGADGKTSYLHIKYSNDGGQTFSNRTGLRMAGFKSLRRMSNGGFRFSDDNIGEVAGEWIGTYVDYEPLDSPDVFRYKWAKIKGNKGDVGDYYEYRYAKNGSTTTPPAIDTSVLVPDGWSTQQPSVGELEYLWTTMAKISGDGQTLLQKWSTPVRFTPKDGADGKQGESPALVFRGEYDTTGATNYYGNKYRVDAVKYNGSYYVARIDAGTFAALPTDTSKWNPFGASFESVATNLLLAENANIAGWVFRNGRMESQTKGADGKPMAYLDGEKGEVRLKGTLQHSTGTTGNFSDVDLFNLPARTTVQSDSVISMGKEREDIGKRCLLTNNSAIGSMGYYRIRSHKFGWNGNTTYSGDSEYYLIAPQETIEMTCFELPTGSSVIGYTVTSGGYWKITNRYHKELAPVVAMGKVYNSTGGASIVGNSIAGTDFAVVRNGTGANQGTYTITLPEFFKYASNLLVMLTGVGYVQGSTTSPAKATLISQNGRTLTVVVSDDTTENGGSFAFVIYSYDGFAIS